MDFRELFHGFNQKNDAVFQKVFHVLKPTIVERIITTLNARPIHHTGRPITTDFNKFLDALYFISESGAQFK